MKKLRFLLIFGLIAFASSYVFTQDYPATERWSEDNDDGECGLDGTWMCVVVTPQE